MEKIKDNERNEDIFWNIIVILLIFILINLFNILVATWFLVIHIDNY